MTLETKTISFNATVKS